MFSFFPLRKLPGTWGTSHLQLLIASSTHPHLLLTPQSTPGDPGHAREEKISLQREDVPPKRSLSLTLPLTSQLQGHQPCLYCLLPAWIIIPQFSSLQSILTSWYMMSKASVTSGQYFTFERRQSHAIMHISGHDLSKFTWTAASSAS